MDNERPDPDILLASLKKTEKALKEEMGKAKGNDENLFALLAKQREISRDLEQLKTTATPKGENG